MIKTLAAAAAALLLTAASAGAQEAVWSDPVAVRQALGQGDDPLLAGLLAAFELRDEAATEALSTFLSRDGGDPEAREAASTALALVHLRTGRYADAAALLEGVLARFEGSADRRRGLEQTLGVARALAAAPAQRRGPFGAGSTPFSRDMAGLPRVPVTINGQTREYVFDTGANFSVVTETQARELGLEMLGETAGVGSVTQDTAAAHMALARTLVIGDLTFENVVFLVMPDASLSFANGAYVIPGIVGFPVISQMERVRVADGTVSWGPSAGVAGERDLFVVGLTPRVYGRISDGAPVAFAFDTGANRTTLRPVVLETRPELGEGATAETQTVGGAGGVRQVEARRLPLVTLTFDQVTVDLRNVTVAGESAGGEGIHGRLGQDVLSRGYVVDFPAGDFSLSPQ